MALTEVKDGETYPIGFEPFVEDEGRVLGWEPIEFTPLVGLLNDCLREITSRRGEDFEFKPGFYRLVHPVLSYDENSAHLV